MSSTRACCSSPRPLTPEQIEEFILVARSWVRQAVETDVVMELPIEAMRECVRAVGTGREAEGADRTRWPVGGADFRETMYGLSWIPAGVEYTTDLAEPARGELRETLERMLRALDAAPPPASRRPPQACDVTRGLIAKPQVHAIWLCVAIGGYAWAHRGDPGGPGLRFIPGSVAGSTPAVASTPALS